MSEYAAGRAGRAEDRAENAADKAEDSKLVQWLGRFGDVCYGVVHVIIAVLAVQVAFGGSSHEADQTGAISAIAAQPFGVVVLWLMAVGLVAFGIWQLLCAGSGFEWVQDKGKRTRKRLGAGGRAVAVLVIAVNAMKLLVSGHNQSQNGKSRTATATLMSAPGGRVLVGIAAAVVLVAAGVIAYRGIRKKFLSDLDTSRVSRATARWVEGLGLFGFVAKGVVYGIVGVLILIAAITFDPKKAGGLDAALHTLAGQPFGVVLLIVVAMGLAAYGGYCFLEARCRRG